MDKIIRARQNNDNLISSQASQTLMILENNNRWTLINKSNYPDYKAMSPKTMSDNGMCIYADSIWVEVFQGIKGNLYNWIFRYYKIDASNGNVYVKEVREINNIKPITSLTSSQIYNLVIGYANEIKDNYDFYGTWNAVYFSPQNNGVVSNPWLSIPTTITGIMTPSEADFLKNEYKKTGDQKYASDFRTMTNKQYGIDTQYYGTKLSSFVDRIDGLNPNNLTVTPNDAIVDNALEYNMSPDGQTTTPTQDNSQPSNTTEVPSSGGLNDNGDIPDTTVIDNNTYVAPNNPVDYGSGSVNNTTPVDTKYIPQENNTNANANANVSTSTETSYGSYVLEVDSKYTPIIIGIMGLTLLAVLLK